MSQIVSFKTAKLAKIKGFNSLTEKLYRELKDSEKYQILDSIHGYDFDIPAPTQEELKKFIREEREVHIEIHRNASGYYWSMCKSNCGTDLGWADLSGPSDAGVWDKYEDALENAMQVQLHTDLTQIKGCWSNYAEYATKRLATK